MWNFNFVKFVVVHKYLTFNKWCSMRDVNLRVYGVLTSLIKTKKECIYVSIRQSLTLRIAYPLKVTSVLTEKPEFELIWSSIILNTILIGRLRNKVLKFLRNMNFDEIVLNFAKYGNILGKENYWFLKQFQKFSRKSCNPKNTFNEKFKGTVSRD